MTPETDAARAWLGQLEMSDPEVKADFRNIATAPDHQPLARTMRQYVEAPIGAALRASMSACLGDDPVERVDFDAIAAQTRDRMRKFGRPGLFAGGLTRA